MYRKIVLIRETGCDKFQNCDVTEFCLFSTCKNLIIHLFYPPKFFIVIVCNFSWDMKVSQEKSKTMPMQIFGG